MHEGQSTTQCILAEWQLARASDWEGLSKPFENLYGQVLIRMEPIQGLRAGNMTKAAPAQSAANLTIKVLKRSPESQPL